MKKNILSKVISLIIVAGLLLGAIPINATAKPMPQTEVFIEQSVLDEMETNGKASYMVQFKNDVDLSPAFSMDWNARGWFVYDTLYAQMRQSQAALQNYLTRAGVEFEPFWINNSIFVRDSTPSVLNAVQSFDGVLSIESEKTMFIYEPKHEQEPDQETMAVEPNIAHIHAPEVWEMGITGEGYTVMNIDTGARYTHEALVNQYRGNLGDGEFDHNYNWFKPYEHIDAPVDFNGHGTHTMGTMVGADASGSNQIGVAPGASWGACMGCPGSSCPGTYLLSCAQFVTAPTKLDGSDPDPDKRPIVVNNSWGNCQQVYNPWYQDAVDAWVAAGVYPVFSNGNAGNCGYPDNPALNTVGNPARYGNVSGVGSTGTDDGVYAPHSNKGPTDNLDEINPVDGWEDLKPQFVAPGVGIRSSIHSSDSAYAYSSGTSMSAPGAAGLVALITQAAPCMQGQYATIETIIEQTATPIPYGYPPDSPETYPNYATGWGEINALAAVQLALSMCGDITLTGTVSSDSDELLSDVKITITPEDGSAQVAIVHTNDAGIYSAKVNPGDYSITASKVGYISQTTTLSIEADSPDPFVLDFILGSRESKLVTGSVSDGGISETERYGYPLMAKLVFEASDHSLETYSDPFSGAYSISLYAGVDYEVTVSSEIPGYLSTSRLLQNDFEPVQDFVIMVDDWDCDAPGYKLDDQWQWFCELIGGGVAAGYVFDANFENTKLINSKVQSIDLSDDTKEYRDFEPWNGLYWFFLPMESDTQAFDFSVTKNNYADLFENHSLTHSQINHIDFALNAGLLCTDPGSIELTMNLFDEPESRTLKIDNLGGTTANIHLVKGMIGFDPLPLNLLAFNEEVDFQEGLLSTGQIPGNDASRGLLRPGLLPNAFKYGINEAPPATGIETISHEVWRWQDLSKPMEYERKGTTGIDGLYAGDFLGTDYETLYAISHADNKFFAIDTSNGASTHIADLTPSVGSFTGITGAWGFFYAVSTTCGNQSVLYLINPDGTSEEIGSIPNAPCMIDIAYVPYEDMLYGVDLVTDSLHRINPHTGHDTVVGSLGFNANYAQGMDYDEANGILYWASQGTQLSELRIIDLQTGASEPIGYFPSNTQVDAYSIEAVHDDAVPWLTIDQNEVAIQPDESFLANIYFTVENKIDQPGDYFAKIGVVADTPYPTTLVPVTLHVLRPDNWGSFKGTVSISEQCDLNPVPIAGAEILIYQDDVLLKQLKSDENGHFSYAFEEGDFKIVFSYPGHVSQVIEDIQLDGGEDLILDINLRHDSACLSYQPETFFSEQYQNHQKTLELNFVNTGARESVVEIREMPGDSLIPESLSIDDGKAENSMHLGFNFIWLNRFTPAEDAFPFTLNAVEVYWHSLTIIDPRDTFDIVIYQNKQSRHDPASGSEFLYRQRIDSIELARFQTYYLDDPVYLEGPGDVLIGIVTPNQYSFWMASIDEDLFMHRSWAGMWDGAIPQEPSLPPDEWFIMDGSYYTSLPSGNWLIRGYGYKGEPRDIPWLDLDSYAGVVPPNGGNLDIMLSFDSNDLESGEYFGDLMISHLPDPWIKLSVKMWVLSQEQLYFPLIRQHLQ